TVNRFQVRTKDLHTDVRAHTSRKHLNAVDDRLSENIAPARHLQYTAHFIVNQISLRSGAAGPKEDFLSHRLFELITEGMKGLQGIRIGRFAELNVERRLGKLLGL